MKHQLNSTNTIPPPRGSSIKGSPHSIKNFQKYYALSYSKQATFWNFIVHDSLEKCLRMKCSIIVTMVNWNQLSMFLESVLYIMYNEITCKTFPRNLILKLFVISKGVLLSPLSHQSYTQMFNSSLLCIPFCFIVLTVVIWYEENELINYLHKLLPQHIEMFLEHLGLLKC